jgi:hypothetical protein
MQEGSQIGWDPLSIDYHLPWESRLFVLYLIAVLAISIVRLGSLVRQFWSLRHALAPKSGSVTEGSELEIKFFNVWGACSAKVQSMKRAVVLTFLLSVLVATDGLRATVLAIADQKAFLIGAFNGGLAEALTLFALGILVCAVLYAICGFCEGILVRRKALWNFSSAWMKTQ